MLLYRVELGTTKPFIETEASKYMRAVSLSDLGGKTGDGFGGSGGTGPLLQLVRKIKIHRLIEYSKKLAFKPK